MKKFIIALMAITLMGCQKDDHTGNSTQVNSIAEITWPKNGGDLRNTNRSMEIRPTDVYPGPQLGQIAWQHVTGAVYTSPTISPDGLIYTASNRTGTLYCMNNSGDSIWGFRVRNFEGDMAIGPSGQIYIGAADSLYAFSSSGERLWGFKEPLSDSFMNPVVGHDGTIYAPSGHDMVALNPDGTKKWRYPAPCASYNVGIVPTATCIYFNANDGIYALNLDGTLKWKYNAYPWWKIVMGANGDIYFHSSNSAVLNCLGKNGQMKWQIDYTAIDTFFDIRSTRSSPAIDKDGSIYTAFEYHIYKFDPSGELLWKFRLPKEVGFSSPVIDSYGYVYICTYHYSPSQTDPSYIYKISGEGQEVWHLAVPGYDFDTTPAIGPDGKMYVGTNADNDGYLLAIE